MDTIVEMKRNLILLRENLEAVKRELIFRRLMRAATKAGFNPNEPRDEDGLWTDGSTATDFSAAKRVASIDYAGAMTGISTIDEVTKTLSEMLGSTMETMDFIPDWTPQVYGTAVHVTFGTAVRLNGIKGIGFDDVEHSFIDGKDADYGEAGSIRTDVLLRNDIGDVIAIYDVKTGKARMSTARAADIREHVGVQRSVPIVELHVLRGARLKARTSNPAIGSVIARLYDLSHHRDSRGRAIIR
jgi:hypothetical protein